MTPEIITSLATGIVAIIAALGSMLVALQNRRLLQQDGREKKDKLDEIHLLVNSRLDEALTKIGLLEKMLSPEQVRRADKQS